MTTYNDEETQPKDRDAFRRRDFIKHSATAGSAILLGVTTSNASSAENLDKSTMTSNENSRSEQTPMGKMTEYKSGDKAIPAYLARTTQKNAPAILVIHEVFGLNDHIKSIADRLANNGYNALAPDLFVRAAEAPPKTDKDVGALRKAVSSIPNDVAIKDMQAGLDFLKTVDGVRPKFASVGFCMGGGFSYQIATHSQDLSGAVIFYGRTPLDLVPQVSCPLVCNFGGLDKGIPTETVKAFEEALKKNGKVADVKIYPDAKHGFFNNTRPDAYNAEAAADAWKRTLAFFHKQLDA